MQDLVRQIRIGRKALIVTGLEMIKYVRIDR